MTMIERMIGAAKLDAATYENIEADQTALPQALTVVALVALAGGIGMIRQGIMATVLQVVAVLVGWAIWSTLTWLIGTKLLAEPQTSADIPEMLRVLGFAYTPMALGFLGIIPYIGWVFGLIGVLWAIACFVVAVRQGLDYTSTGRAIGVVVLASLGFWLVYCLMSLLGLGGAIGMSALSG